MIHPVVGLLSMFAANRSIDIDHTRLAAPGFLKRFPELAPVLNGYMPHKSGEVRRMRVRVPPASLFFSHTKGIYLWT